MMNSPVARTPIVAFASGKGGVGKTSLCLNVATLLAKQGKKVLVFDGDIGLANIDVQLAMAPEKDLSHVLNGQASLEEIITKSERGFYVIPGRSGLERTPFLTALERRDLLNKLRDVAGAFDLVILDVAAGVDEEVLGFANFADRAILITTPDPSSITDAYAVMKLLKLHHNRTNCELVLNQVGSKQEGDFTYEKLKTAAEKFLGLGLPLAGIIPYDRQYATAVKMQKIAVNTFPNAEAPQAIEKLAANLLEEVETLQKTG